MDRLTAKQRSANMRNIKSKGMKPELLVRRLVHKLGYRFRLHREDLPGRPDLIFPARRKIIFVHGCFWHVHGAKSCKIKRQPKSNTSYWSPKLLKNRERDAKHLRALKKLGWSTLVLWECELKAPEKLTNRIERFLGTASSALNG